jgi:hypothetical protein
MSQEEPLPDLRPLRRDQIREMRPAGTITKLLQGNKRAARCRAQSLSGAGPRIWIDKTAGRM